VYDPAFMRNVETVVTAANVVLLMILLAIYVWSYARIKSKFAMGLIVFVSIRRLQAITSTQCMHSTCLHAPDVYNRTA
jgi:uncharacterized membrane protein YqjE